MYNLTDLVHGWQMDIDEQLREREKEMSRSGIIVKQVSVRDVVMNIKKIRRNVCLARPVYRDRQRDRRKSRRMMCMSLVT